MTFLADDGEHLVTGYDGGELLPLEDPEKTVVLEFRRRETLLRVYTLADLGYRRADLMRTASHYHWGRYVGFDDDGQFGLSMVDGTDLLFDPSTGALLRRFPRDE